MIDVNIIKKDFPILSKKVNGKNLTYLDNGATSQKPERVIDAIADYYRNSNSNIHRGIHILGDRSTKLYNDSRRIVADFIGADDSNELLFVRNTTEGINLVACAWGRKNIGKGDTILLTEMEHHSNVVPWQVLAEEVGAKIEYVLVDDNGKLNMDDLKEKMNLKPKLFSLVHVSNFLGTVNDIKKIVGEVKKSKTFVMVDGAQAVPHMRVSVSDLGVDFYAFSGHKMLGPMGIGGVYIKKDRFGEMSPFLYGGGMISEVYREKSSFADLPDRYDAGTPNVAGAVGLAAAVSYLKKIGMEEVQRHGRDIIEYGMERLMDIDGVKIFGPMKSLLRSGVIAFTLDGIHAHDVAQVLDREMGVAVRSGHHCTMIMHQKLGLPATTRASFYIYNDRRDVDTLVEGIVRVKKIFGVDNG